MDDKYINKKILKMNVEPTLVLKPIQYDSIRLQCNREQINQQGG